MTNAYSPLVSGTATWMRKSWAPEVTNRPMVSGSWAAHSRKPSMTGRDGGRIRTEISAWTGRPTASRSTAAW